MAFFKSLVGKLCIFSLLCSATIAAPLADVPLADGMNEPDVAFNKRDLGKRVLRDQNNPIDVTFNIAGWPNIAEQDCFAMLCLLGGNRVYQRVSTAGAGSVNYRHSGATFHPFQPQNLDQRHTTQINVDTTSAGEFPWDSTTQGGSEAFVFPATIAEQRSQSGSITGGYISSHVDFSEWFRISFTGAPLGTYCTALFQTPPDTSVCGNNQQITLWGSVIALPNFAYQVSKPFPDSYGFIHAAGPNKGQYTNNKRSEDFENLPRMLENEPIYSCCRI